MSWGMTLAIEMRRSYAEKIKVKLRPEVLHQLLQNKLDHIVQEIDLAWLDRHPRILTQVDSKRAAEKRRGKKKLMPVLSQSHDTTLQLGRFNANGVPDKVGTTPSG